MKRTAPWTEDIEKAVAKAYKQGGDDALAYHGKTLAKVYKLASEIMGLTAGFQPPEREDPIMTRGTGPKRKAVTVTDDQRASVLAVLESLSQRNNGAFKPKALCGATGLSTKRIGEALRILVKSDMVIEVKPGFFKAKPADNGSAASAGEE